MPGRRGKNVRERLVLREHDARSLVHLRSGNVRKSQLANVVVANPKFRFTLVEAIYERFFLVSANVPSESHGLTNVETLQ